MAWAVPLYSKSQVDAAGASLVDPDVSSERLDEALDIVNNWRSSHSFPLNTFQVGLRRNARQQDRSALVAQRLKRLSSIQAKLLRFPKMQLSRMQDIGGCRAVLTNVRQTRDLRQVYLTGDLKHALVNQKDYIEQPKESGYRGIHLMYRYRSDRKATYNGLLLEVQIRTQLQHAWATAVETVGTFLEQSLKSSQGSGQWLRFFSLVGSAFALLEHTPPVPGVPTQKTALLKEARHLSTVLDVRKKLEAYGAALQTLEGRADRGSKYFLLALRPSASTLTVTAYAADALQKATDDYLVIEKSIAETPGAEAVLVSAESLDSLRRAYPNYFLDTRVFIAKLREALAQ